MCYPEENRLEPLNFQAVALSSGIYRKKINNIIRSRRSKDRAGKGKAHVAHTDLANRASVEMVKMFMGRGSCGELSRFWWQAWLAG